MTDWANEIKSRVSMRDIVERYGFKSKNNRIPCPFHGGEHPNLGFDKHTFHCFTCGISGDIFTFVEKYFSISFSDAVKKINDDFYLNLPISEKMTLRQKREIEHRKKQQEIEKMKKNHAIEMWDNAVEKLQKIQYDYDKYYPKTEAEKENPDTRWLIALSEIETAKQNLYYAESELMKYDNR